MAIATVKGKAPSKNKRFVAEQIWLHYFNKVLFESGLITEEERIRTKNRIDARKPPSAESKTEMRRTDASP